MQAGPAAPLFDALPYPHSAWPTYWLGQTQASEGVPSPGHTWTPISWMTSLPVRERQHISQNLGDACVVLRAEWLGTITRRIKAAATTHSVRTRGRMIWTRQVQAMPFHRCLASSSISVTPVLDCTHVLLDSHTSGVGRHILCSSCYDICPPPCWCPPGIHPTRRHRAVTIIRATTRS